MKRILILILYSITLYGGHLNVGYGSAAMSEFSKEDTMIAMKIWLGEVFKQTDHTASFRFYDSTQQMADDFETGKVDYVVTYGLEFIKYFKKENLSDGFTGGMHDRQLEHIVIVLPKGKTMKDFLLLKKPTIAVQVSEEISRLYIEYLFLKNTKHENINFLHTTKRSGALLKLFFNQADAAVVTQKTFNFAQELNPQIGQKLQVMHQTDIPVGSFGFFRNDLDEEFKDEIEKEAFKIVNTERGKQVFSMFKTDEIVKSYVKELAPIEKLYTNYQRLKNEK